MERPADVLHACSITRTPARASTTRCCGSAAREVTADRSSRRSRADSNALYYVLAARRHLHADCRRGRTAAPAGRPGDAAFLLAVPRVLRRVHVLVQRAARSARLGLLLGGRGVDSAAAAALPAFHARCSPSGRAAGCARRSGARRAAAAVRCRRSLLGARARRRGGARAARRASSSRSVLEHARSRRAALSRGLPRRRPRGAGARVRRRAIGHRAAAAAVDCVGHGARRAAVRGRLRAAVRARRSRRRCRWSCRRCR